MPSQPEETDNRFRIAGCDETTAHGLSPGEKAAVSNEPGRRRSHGVGVQALPYTTDPTEPTSHLGLRDLAFRLKPPVLRVWLTALISVAFLATAVWFFGN